MRKKAREEDLREERQRAGKRMAEVDDSRGDAATRRDGPRAIELEQRARRR